MIVLIMLQALHVIALLVGAYIFYMTFVMRESTEGKWVNRIEELWIRIDDRNKAVGDTTRALSNALAEKIAKGFNRLVGIKAISLRLVGFSSSLSFASLFFFFGCLLELTSYLIVKYSELLKRTSPSADQIEKAFPLMIVFGFVFIAISVFCLTLAFLPVIFRSTVWVWLSCLPALLLFTLNLKMVYLHLANPKQLTIVAALAMSLASDVMLLVIIRQSLRWMLAYTSLMRVTVTVAIQVVLIFVVFLSPLIFLFDSGTENAKNSLGVILLTLGVFNLPTALASMAFILSIGVVLLHRITWPLLSQLAYVLTRSEVLEKRKTLRTIAASLIVFGLSGIPALSFLQKLAEHYLR